MQPLVLLCPNIQESWKSLFFFSVIVFAADWEYVQKYYTWAAPFQLISKLHVFCNLGELYFDSSTEMKVDMG